ncbi:MAG: ATP-binding cassette domain-containing protein [Gemmatimonadetes bacterium]|nr:ATP-binding cassette domain-containing protein [Gemmatimonadota bacterium]
MAQLSAQNIRIAFGGRPLLEDANLQIERRERVGLLGRNGEGKSTLLAVLAGATQPDKGVVTRESGVRVALLTQQLPSGLAGTVADVIRSGLHGPATGHGEADHHVQRLCSLLELDPDAEFATRSGGQKRKALLGRSLASEPDVLLLDEPTNHLDIAGIEWLESFLLRANTSLLFVTHDRAFLQRLATRIVELDRGQLSSWACDYHTYLVRKEEQLVVEEKERALFDKNLAREEAWIRQGIKARRTRNEGRVRALERLRVAHADRRDRPGQVRLSVSHAERSGTRVIVADHVSFGYGEQPVIEDFSTTILRGDKVGIIGPNGSGKTTLLRLLLGQLEPASGTVKHGTALDVAYFDQHRAQLDEAETVEEAVGQGGDHVTIDGERKHVMSYLADFLFSSERARQPVRSLSGGERNRLLLARLFTRPANVLVLDEPTNDLDAETLELLEARLVEFAGTVLAVSHDRAFLDNLCSSTLVFEEAGVVREYVGGYSDWKRVAGRRDEESAPFAAPSKTKPAPSGARPDAPRKLSFAERRELEGLPARIEALEVEIAELHAHMADPEYYKKDPGAMRGAVERVREAQAEIEAAFRRWAELVDLLS